VDIRQPIPDRPGEFMFADYSGGCNYDKGLEYLRGKFVEVAHGYRKTLFTRVTCATDTENVRVVFNACKDTILQRNVDSAEGAMH
jgi:hypothetical protein